MRDTDDSFDQDTQKNKYLNFAIDNENFALDIADVIEIVGMQAITEVPEMANYVKGVINLRGQVIPVVDVRLRFAKEERNYDDRTCIIVINVDQVFAGLIVDTVKDVTTIEDEQISPPPNLGNQDLTNAFLKGLANTDEGVKIIVDTGKLLNLDTLELIES